jgi:hypothetical protein
MEVRITKVRVAMAALFVLAGIGLASLLSPLVGTALANVGQVVNISDHSGSAFFAEVDSAGKLAVGDGAGPLSVDGTVASRPAAPASPWRAHQSIQGVGGDHWPIAGPSASPINLTSLSFTTQAATGQDMAVELYGFHVANSATGCGGPTLTFDAVLWSVLDAGDGVTPLLVTFPTPLQWKPPANTKACLMALAYTPSGTIMNAVGFYGG